MFKAARALPLARLVALAEIAMLARRHLKALSPHERRRMIELARKGRRMSADERRELLGLAGKIDARAFASDAARTFSPFGRRRRSWRRR